METQGWSLRRQLLAGASAIILLPAIAAGIVSTSQLRSQEIDRVTADLASRGAWAARQIASRLDELSQEIDRLSRDADLADPAKLRVRLTLAAQLDRRFSWIGVAGMDGKVLASSDAILENISMAQQVWFREGLRGAFVGDVHEAALAQETHRFIDFAAPVRDASGRTVAVLGAHFDWRWMEKLVDSFGIAGSDVLLLSGARRVLHGPPGLRGQPLSTGTAFAGAVGLRGARIERWPDGRDYLAVAMPIRGEGRGASFGWSFALRQDLAAVGRQTGHALGVLWGATGAALALTLIALAGLIAALTRPIARTAQFAAGLAEEGRAGAPEAVAGCREARQLTAALTRLQSQLAVASRLRRAV